MKITMIIILSILSILVIAQILISKNSRDTEQHKYEVLKKFDKFEVRKYEAAIFSSVKLNVDSYKETSGKGFRILAGYIFGDNESNEKIAMTSPVVMEISDTSKMSFMVPKEMSLENLPKPKNKEIIFEKQNEKIMAAIQFDGWADDEKIEFYKTVLIEELSKHNIAHYNKFLFLGYNPPFDLVDRRNEVVIELVDYKE